ncbi:hypothetical protein GCM10010400_75580 [Streptomyces aculeolatus]|uniref:hypothetical protein n=1 Tax=Streptomyces aculeolatus TaxID=270689 RepID=UPI001CEC4D78|nr:hypothetical protein [Streptomyces aculeolatus]
MPESSPPPTRVMFRGGRVVHAVRPGEGARTVCGSRLLPGEDRPQPDDAPITCPRCCRLTSEAAR